MKLAAFTVVAVSVVLAAGCGGDSPETVGTDQIEDGAVVTRKLADGAVSTAKLEDGSVTLDQLTADAVDGSKVADDSLGGPDIEESTLEGVNAATLNGSASYVNGIETAQQTSSLNANDRKGPVTATCPEGTTVVAGGASIVTETGTKLPVALTASTSNTGNGWNAEALEIRPVDDNWGLRVIALCGVVSG